MKTVLCVTYFRRRSIKIFFLWIRIKCCKKLNILQRNDGMVPFFKIYIIGSSHGKRLGQVLRRHKDCGTKFQVFCYSVPGKSFDNLVWPDLSKLSSTDLLIIIPFGNDLVDRKYIHRGVQDRIIHLTKFVPRTDEYFLPKYRSLSDKLEGVRANIRILGNFYRHLCCQKHIFPGWIAYQNKINRQIAEFFSGTQVQVLDHRSLLPLKFWEAKNVRLYSAQQYDSVHFRDYTTIAEKILFSLN